MSTPSPTPTPAPIPDSPPHAPPLPLPLSASIVLTSLPPDATSALSRATTEDAASVPAKGIPPFPSPHPHSPTMRPRPPPPPQPSTNSTRRSNHPPPTHRQRPPPPAKDLQSLEREPIRDYSWVFAQEAAGGERWGGRRGCGRWE